MSGPRSRILVTAHAGALGTPSNSLASLDAAMDAKADVIEFDLRLTADGLIFLSHNESLHDVHGRSLRIVDHTRATLLGCCPGTLGLETVLEAFRKRLSAHQVHRTQDSAFGVSSRNPETDAPENEESMPWGHAAERTIAYRAGGTESRAGADRKHESEPQGSEHTCSMIPCAAAHAFEPGFCMLNLDIKEPGALEPAALVLRAQGLETRALFSGLDLEGIRKAAASEAVQGIPYLFNADALVPFPVDTPEADGLSQIRAERVCELATECGCSGINLEWIRADRVFVRRCRELGMRIMLWTVDDPDAMRSVLALEPDSITTNRPDLLFELLGEEGSPRTGRH